jgi:hypothetical protein
MYAQCFAGDTSSYINWILDLELPVPGRRVDFQITAVYYFSNSASEWEEFHRHNFDASVEGDWTWSYHKWDYGCDDPEGCWEIDSC